MKSLTPRLTLAAVLSVGFLSNALFATSAFAAEEIPQVSLCKTAFIDDKPIIRATAQILEHEGLADQAYVTEWKALTPEGQGPYRASGDMLVVPVKSENVDEWFNTIGRNSMGFMVEKLPENIGHTAHLRVGNRIFTYAELQFTRETDSNTLPVPKLLKQMQDRGFSYTELTIPMTKAEQDALIEFLEERRAGNIIAQFDVKNGPIKGETIRPDFDQKKCSLAKESCAAAATSPFNPIWLDHYTKPGGKILRDFAERMSLQPTFVAKRTLWAHVRNPQTPVMTLLGVDKSSIAGMQNDFVGTHQWGRLHGLPLYGHMPDPRSGRTTTIESKRTPLKEWMAKNPAQSGDPVIVGPATPSVLFSRLFQVLGI